MKRSILKLLTLGQVVFLFGCAHSGSLRGSEPVTLPPSSTQEIADLFEQWNDSVVSGNPSAVVTNYASYAVLLPTVSSRVRTTEAEITDYFVHFLEKKPRGTIDQANIRRYGDIAINSGLYSFTFEDDSIVHARYTFVYEKQPNGNWLIVEHHSSKLPE